MTSLRPSKRRRVETQIAAFLDIEAEVEGEDISEDENDYDQGFVEDEEEIYADDDIFSHTFLTRQYEQIRTGDIDHDWSTFLMRARHRSREDGSDTNAEIANEGPREGDRLYEIRCQLGMEELAVLKVLYAAADPALVVYSAFARKSLPGRIFAEVPSIDAAKALGKRISDLSEYNVRPIPRDHMTGLLDFGGKAGPRTQTWVRIQPKQKRYKRYAGDIGLVVAIEKSGQVEVWLAPRLGPADGSMRPRQLLFDETQVQRADTPSVHRISEGRAVLRYGRERYSRQGYLIVFGPPDLVACSGEVIPTAEEFTLFKGCDVLDPLTRQRTEEMMLWNNLRFGDRVKVKTSCLQGLSGKIQEISGNDAHVHFPSLGVTEVVLLKDLRKDFRPGDQVIITSGDHENMKAWIVEVLDNRAVVFNLDKFLQVEVLFHHLEFYEEWDTVCLRSLSDAYRPATEDDRMMKHDPNRKFIGKEVMIVGANHFKGCRGVIRDTTPNGEALVELAIFNHPRLEKFRLSDLRLVRDDKLLEMGSGRASRLMLVPSVPAAPQLLPPSTPFPDQPVEETLSAWDPSSRTPEIIMDIGPVEPARWLADPCVRGIRVVITECGSDSDKFLEVKSVVQEVVTVRDGTHTRTLPLDRVNHVIPTRKENPVVSFADDQNFGKLFTIKTFGLQECDVRHLGSKSGKGEVLHKLATATLAVVYPPFKGRKPD